MTEENKVIEYSCEERQVTGLLYLNSAGSERQFQLKVKDVNGTTVTYFEVLDNEIDISFVENSELFKSGRIKVSSNLPLPSS